jgi:hypothetical protein
MFNWKGIDEQIKLINKYTTQNMFKIYCMKHKTIKSEYNDKFKLIEELKSRLNHSDTISRYLNIPTTYEMLNTYANSPRADLSSIHSIEVAQVTLDFSKIVD